MFFPVKTRIYQSWYFAITGFGLLLDYGLNGGTLKALKVFLLFLFSCLCVCLSVYKLQVTPFDIWSRNLIFKILSLGLYLETFFPFFKILIFDGFMVFWGIFRVFSSVDSRQVHPVTPEKYDLKDYIPRGFFRFSKFYVLTVLWPFSGFFVRFFGYFLWS